MTQFGYKLMTEEHGPRALVENSVRAEAAGFDFASISDHFHPWLESQGHSPFAWSVLGAIAQATSTLKLTTGLTCPIIRYHPAIIAQAAATVALLSEGRFTLAVGAGERLNEHVTGARWPSISERHEMLGEAIHIFRTLWGGGVHNHDGPYYVLDHAQLYDTPDKPIPVVVGVSGDASIHLALSAEADGIMATSPEAELVSSFTAGGGDTLAYGEVALAFAASEEEGRELAHRQFRFSAFEWSVNSEIPHVKGFEAASKFVKPEDLADTIPAGPDPEVHLSAIRKYVDAGFTHVVLTGIGPDQEGFVKFFEEELKPRLS